MKRLLRNNPEKASVAAAAALLAAALAWVWFDRLEDLPRHRPRTGVAAAVGVVRSVSTGHPDSQSEDWLPPAPQSAGDGWIYELFSPPDINFDREARSFSVTPPFVGPALRPNDEGAAVELVAVNPVPFRLQLAGYYGAPGAYTGIFVSPSTAEALIGPVGTHFAQLGLRVKELGVAKSAVADGEPASGWEIHAVAVVLDEHDGSEVTLDTRTRALTGESSATLRVGAGETGLREVRAGDWVTCEKVTYRVDRIQASPPEVVLVGQASDSRAIKTRVLNPVTSRGALALVDDEADGEAMSADDGR